ncbi:MAG TPA: demethoxyubiquinone hydroxylase family protein, partial [Candidatus Luteimonas excrementigallinarum]|nr:demethoxyubiquinone hydroxylase family protein [Candidatus Luteimonas excrementigallinarum]
MNSTRRLTPLDQFLSRTQHALDTVFGRPAAERPNPAGDEPDVALDPAERRHAAGLMRINHV